MEPQTVAFASVRARVRVGLAPRAEPFDESMDSLQLAASYAVRAGFQVKITKVRRGCPGFSNAGPLMQQMIAEGDTHLIIAADDMLYPEDFIVRLVNDDKDVVNGIYRKNMVQQLTPANHIEKWEDFAERYKTGGLHQTQFATGHTMTIKRHVIEKMIADHPELAYKVGDQTQFALFLPMVRDGVLYQDDWSFSIRARESGFTLWDDYDCKLKHYCYDFLGFEALDVPLPAEVS